MGHLAHANPKHEAGSDALRALLAGDPGEDFVESGADPDGPFCAAVTRSNAAWAPPPGLWYAAVDHDGLSWTLVQTPSDRDLLRLVPAPGAVGLPRQGWAGGRKSIEDARLALAVTRGNTVAYADEWVLASVLRDGPRISDLCSRASEVATTHPHLAEAVQAFADNGLSLTAAARALFVHPNTVIYRLDRWHRLTGWDPRTFGGLVQSVACLRVSPD